MTLFQMDDLQKTILNLLVGIGFLPEAFNWQDKGRPAGQNPQQLALGGATPMPVIWH
jgi:hypothetical protein